MNNKGCNSTTDCFSLRVFKNNYTRLHVGLTVPQDNAHGLVAGSKHLLE